MFDLLLHLGANISAVDNGCFCVLAAGTHMHLASACMPGFLSPNLLCQLQMSMVATLLIGVPGWAQICARAAAGAD